MTYFSLYDCPNPSVSSGMPSPVNFLYALPPLAPQTLQTQKHKLLTTATASIVIVLALRVAVRSLPFAPRKCSFCYFLLLLTLLVCYRAQIFPAVTKGNVSYLLKWHLQSSAILPLSACRFLWLYVCLLCALIVVTHTSCRLYSCRSCGEKYVQTK